MVSAATSYPGSCQSATMSASSITTSPTSTSSWAAITAVTAAVSAGPRLRWVSPSGSWSGAGMDAIGHVRDSTRRPIFEAK